MKVTKESLKDKVIDRIDSLSRDKLKALDEFIDKLENETKEKILSYAGAWSDLDEATFSDLTKKLHENRQQGSKRIL